MKLHLGKARFTVQVISLVTLLYGGAIFGHYTAELLSNALPALACAYNSETSDYCILIPTQHQLHHRVGEAIVRMQGFAFSMIIPLLFTLLNFFILFFFLNKAFCGWICPLGTIQEIMYKLGRLFKRPFHALSEKKAKQIRPIKWLMLLVLVMLLPLTAGLGITSHATGDAFCQVCPSRVLSTLASGDAEQLAINTSSTMDAIFGAIRSFLAGFIIIAAIAVRQPFCRICPMLSLHAIFRRLSLTRLTKKKHKSCDKCGICTKACPMDITEIWKEDGNKAFNEDCTLCGRCVEYCPQDDVISIKTGPFNVMSSSRDYYKARVKSEKPDGTIVTSKKVKSS